jgi:hypothetical protein
LSLWHTFPMHGGGILKALHSNNIQYFSNQGEMGTEYRNKDFCFGKGRFPPLFRPFLRDTLLFHKYVYILTSIASLSSSLPAKVGRAVPAIYTKVSSLYKHRHDISMINIYTHRARPPAHSLWENSRLQIFLQWCPNQFYKTRVLGRCVNFIVLKSNLNKVLCWIKLGSYHVIWWEI